MSFSQSIFVNSKINVPTICLAVIICCFAVLSVAAEPGPASEPFPAHMAQKQPLNVTLSWQSGTDCTNQHLYFSDNFEDVNEAFDSNLYPGRGLLDSNQITWKDPYGLDYQTEYYWRVDEFNSVTSELRKGTVWQFSTVKYLPQDLTNDKKIDLSDLRLLLNKWVDDDAPDECDLNSDGIVNAADYALFAKKWGFAGTTYYVSSSQGSDINTGTDPNNPWATLHSINRRTFYPGDKILFQAGTQYLGKIKPQGSGAKGFPIIIDTYGQGPKPRIDAQVLDNEALLIENVEYWEVNNLELTNRGNQVAQMAGVTVHIDNFGKARHIYLNNLYVHDVNGPPNNVLLDTGYGIYWKNEGNQIPSVFDDLRIENCHIKDVNCRAIQGQCAYGHISDWHPSVNVIIRNNLVENIGGAAITTIGTHGCLIEYNRVDGVGTVDRGNGIHPFKSDNTIIQYNEVSNCKGPGEGWGFNSDQNCRNSLYQYNYSHDNEGGFQLIIGSDGDWRYGNVSTVTRYNISQNDGYRIDRTDNSPIFNITGSVHNARIYNNTIYIGTRKEPEDLHLVRFFNAFGEWPDDIAFNNNIFYADGTVTFDWGQSTNVLFSNNAWYGNITGIPADTNGVFADPSLVDPNSGTFGLDSLDGYKLQNSSPCLLAGTTPDIDLRKFKNGNKDFWQNPLPQDGSPVDIGAHQHGIRPPANDPVLWYTFDETSGSIAYDTMSNSNAALTKNGMWAEGRNGGALCFDGTYRADIINEPNVFDSASQTQITFSMWLKGDPNGDYSVMRNVFAGRNSDDQLAVLFRCPQPVPPAATGDITFRHGAPAYDMTRWDFEDFNDSDYKGQWRHYALVKDAVSGFQRIYRDGQLVAELTQTFNSTNITVFTLGAEANSTLRAYEGMMDDFQVYNYALNWSEIRYLADN
jgi:hypothetical protein